MECLNIHPYDYIAPHFPRDMESGQWLELLHPFLAVRDPILGDR